MTGVLTIMAGAAGSGAAVAVHALCAGADHPTEAPAQTPPAAEGVAP